MVLRAIFVIFLLSLIGCGGSGGGEGGSVTSRNAEISQIVPVNIILVKGSGGVSASEAEFLFAETERTLESSLGIDLYLSSLDVRENPVPEIRDPSLQGALLQAWKEWAESEKRMSRNSLLVVLLPPYIKNNQYLFGGIASGICEFRRSESLALVAVGPTTAGPDSEDRLIKSAKTLAHEISHLLGSEHREGGQLMAKVFNFEVTPALGLEEESIAEIQRCLGIPPSSLP